MKPTLLVLAAGMGSRYGGLKQIDPIGPNQETLLDYSLFDAIRAGFGKVVFVIRPDFADQFRGLLEPRLSGRIAIGYATQELSKTPAWFHPPGSRTKPWGTGHAVLVARDLIEEPFAMINADDFYGSEGFALMARELQGPDAKRGDRYAMVGYPLGATLSEHGTVSRGLCAVDASDRLKEVVEHTRIEKTASGALDLNSGAKLSYAATVSMNFFGFKPSIFGHLEAAFERFLRQESNLASGELYIPAVVDSVLKARLAEVRILKSRDAWFGVTYRDDKARVAAGIAALVQAGRYPERLWG